MSKGIFFISHAHADAAWAEAIETLLVSGLGVRGERIVRTSADHRTMQPGQNVEAWIRDRLASACGFIACLTEAYLHSPWCMAELGAAWYRTPPLDDGEAKKPRSRARARSAAAPRRAAAPFALVPLVLPPLTKDALRSDGGILAHRLVLDLEELDGLYKAVLRATRQRAPPPQQWESARETFAGTAQGVRPAPAERAPLREIHGVRFQRCFPDEKGALVVLDDLTSDDLRDYQGYVDPYDQDRHQRFLWDEAVQLVSLFEHDGRFDAVKLVVADGEVTEENRHQEIVSTNLSSGGPETTIRVVPSVFRKDADRWSPVHPHAWSPEPPEMVRPLDGHVSKLFTRRWRIHPADCGLRAGDLVRFLVVTEYQDAFGGSRKHEFWSLTTHLSVKGTTSYVFLGNEAVSYVRRGFTFPFGRGGFMPLDEESLAPRLASDRQKLREWLAFVGQHLDVGSLSATTAAHVRSRMLAGSEPRSNDLDLVVDSRRDGDLARERLLVWSSRTGGPPAKRCGLD